MLLDRKKINRIARWFAIGMAIIFALGTIFLGVGSKTGNVFAGCTKSTDSSISASSSFQDKEDYYKKQIDLNPQDKDSMLQLASLYADQSVGRYDDAIFWLNKYLEQDPKNNDVRLRIARIQMEDKQDFAGAVTVLTQATTQDPNNPLAYLLLGQAAQGAGQNQTAILAWNRYLQLAPNSEYASLVKDQIAQLSAKTSTTATTPAAPAAGPAP